MFVCRYRELQAALQCESRLPIATSAAARDCTTAKQRSVLRIVRRRVERFHRPAPVGAPLLTQFLKIFFEAKSGVPDAAFVPAAWGASAVKRAACAPANDICIDRKRPFDGCFCNSKHKRRKSPPRRGTHAIACPRAVECVAFSMSTTTLRTRFLNAEDVFFLSAVVIENAVPTIRVGAEATPPLGSD
jgi:hypothetical protein